MSKVEDKERFEIARIVIEKLRKAETFEDFYSIIKKHLISGRDNPTCFDQVYWSSVHFLLGREEYLFSRAISTADDARRCPKSAYYAERNSEILQFARKAFAEYQREKFVRNITIKGSQEAGVNLDV